MHRILEYSVLFVAVVLLQVFLFSNLSLGVYVRPMIYLAFIVLLPLNMRWGWMVVAGLLSGVVMDILLGGEGLHVIATVAAAFCRPLLLYRYVVGDEHENGVPGSRLLGRWPFFRYVLTMVLIHHAVFFTFENLGFTGYLYVVIRIVTSAIMTALAVYLIQMVFSTGRIPYVRR